MQGVAMVLQNRYQRQRLYTRIALGKAKRMDVLWGETAGVDGQLWLLYPILFAMQGEGLVYRKSKEQCSNEPPDSTHPISSDDMAMMLNKLIVMMFLNHFRVLRHMSECHFSKRLCLKLYLSGRLVAITVAPLLHKSVYLRKLLLAGSILWDPSGSYGSWEFHQHHTDFDGKIKIQIKSEKKVKLNLD
ncbi:hypothetical protein ACH5RR_041864 [Cinchona calisaya]|uniref:Uncharacterized protein n=1 Tax=Cinchona calisaya TaxID=153742 RepID=A0ABD2XXZ1_9GENT